MPGRRGGKTPTLVGVLTVLGPDPNILYLSSSNVLAVRLYGAHTLSLLKQGQE